MVYESNPLLHRDPASFPSFALFAYGSQLLRTVAPAYFEKSFGDLAALGQRVGYESVEWRASIATTYVKNLGRGHHLVRASRSMADQLTSRASLRAPGAPRSLAASGG